MCLSPITIKNPYCGCDPAKGYNYLHDCVSTKIQVPCGHCKECLNTRQSAFAVRCDIESLKYISVPFMLTITYDNAHIPRFVKVGDILDDFAYPNWKHVQDMMKRLRIFIARNPDSNLSKLLVPFRHVQVRGRDRLLPPFKYVFVSEFGKNHLRPHFHALIYFRSPYSRRDDRFEIWRHNVEIAFGDWFKNNWSINVGTRKEPVYDLLYTYIVKGQKRTFDFHAVVHSDSAADNAAVYYVSKYLFKSNEKLEKFKRLVFVRYKQGLISDERYKKFKEVTSRNLRVSKYFGYPFDDVQLASVDKGFSFAVSQKMPYPCYIASDGQQQVFPQYLKRLITPDLATFFCYNIVQPNFENDVRELEKINIRHARVLQSEDEFEKIRRSIHSYDDCLSDLFGYSDELRNYQGCSEESTRQLYDTYKYLDRKPDISTGLDPDVNFYRHVEDKPKQEEIIIQYLF